MVGGWGIDVSLEIRRLKDRQDRVGQPVPPGAAEIAVNDGSLVGFFVENRSFDPVDVTLLHIDDAFGITAAFPRAKNVAGSYWKAGQRDRAFFGAVGTTRSGQEHVLMIAVKSGDSRVNFRGLAQPSIEQAQREEGTGRAIGSELGKLLMGASFGQPGRRSLSTDALENCCIRAVSWRTPGNDE